jgi:hypothetical protein
MHHLHVDIACTCITCIKNSIRFCNLGTPKIIISGSTWVYPLYLSTLEITASVQNYSDFPPTLETRWKRNGVDINITDIRYRGSSLDLFNPKLVINRVDFYHEEYKWYQCVARNSEGWGTSTFQKRVNVQGSTYLVKLQVSTYLHEAIFMGIIQNRKVCYRHYCLHSISIFVLVLDIDTLISRYFNPVSFYPFTVMLQSHTAGFRTGSIRYQNRIDPVSPTL